MRPVSSTPLSPEARATIRKYLSPSLGDAEVQRMIDEYEGVAPEPAPQPQTVSAADRADLLKPTRAELWAPSPARSLEDGKEKLREVGGHRMTLGQAVALPDRLFTDSLPYDSMLERSYRNCRPSNALLPGIDVALRSPEPGNPGETLALAEKMFEALPIDPNDPMQKGFAGLRLLMAVARTMGDVRVSGMHDLMTSPLSNLRDDARSETLGKLMVSEVHSGFQAMRQFVDERGQVVNPNAPTISEGLDTVTIGGVTLEIRK